MRFIITFLIFTSISLMGFSQQGKVEGKVTDAKTGSPLSGVSVLLNGSTTGVATDIDGRFVVSLTPGKTYTLRVTSVGFKTKELTDVTVTPNNIASLEIAMETAAKTETEIVITGTARKETVAALISYQKNTNTVAQVISSEAIRRSPDRNTGEVLKRVPGTSIQDGKYLVVRGLADRYNQAMLNGILLSSTEPDRKTFSFDIFPASIVDNIIINKAFVPELPGEWAGGIIQVNTKDVPAQNFLTIQVGTGFNTQTIGKDFYAYAGGNYDFLGFDNGFRGLADNFPRRGEFVNMTAKDKTALASSFQNVWHATTNKQNYLPQLSENLQLSGGFNKHLGKNKLAAIFAINYNRANRRTDYENRIYSIQNNVASESFDYFNKKYSRDILAGALANVTLQLGANNKVSFKNILNVNTTNYSTLRTGKDFESGTGNALGYDNIRASELAFKANTFFNTQLSGDHNLKSIGTKLHWYGSFNILDQYIPDQRRIQYNQDDPTNPNSPYSALIGQSPSSQKSGSRYFGYLSDYIYTAGGDITKEFGRSQSVKGGYFFQVKDRLFDSRPFAIYLPKDNTALKHLDPSVIFSPENFGSGSDNKFALNEISGDRYRYLANSILNAGFLQFDNLINENIRVVWGVRVEDFDQIIGSVRQSDPRHFHSKKTDYLPGVNITYKINNKTNFRISGSQTIIRPEFRELSSFSFYDFDLGATVTGEPRLQRSKITNADLRYEVYPRAGELFTLGVFYKYFINPIELYFNQTGAGSSSTFNYINSPKASSYGAELEFRKKLDFNETFKNFTLQGNFSYIYNRVPSLNRPMQGQSPYIINFSAQYDIDKLGLSTTLLFNQIGRRIYYVGNSTSNGTINNDNFPPVWESPRGLLDFQIAKKVLKNHGEFKLNVSDILNLDAKFYHDLNDNKKYDKDIDALAIRRKYGSNVGLTFSYNIK
ncbi:MAG: outer membrane beta-barrel protein [Ginsengibacter sp.]